MEQEKRNKTKNVIIVLAVLLVLSLIALAGTLIYNKLAANTDTTVTVPDNLITPDEYKQDDKTADQTESDPADENQDTSAGNTLAAGNGMENKKQAVSIALYKKQPQDNTAFTVGNMFPGDSETRYYGVQVSYHDKVTVHFKGYVHNGYEKLAEVMKVKIKLLNTDEVLYDGLMRDMPESVTYRLSSYKSTTDELYYEITAYLDTSVGNEYQNKELIADFKWWVEETGNLDKAPRTGDDSNIMIWVILAAVSASGCIILLVIRRKEEDGQNG